MNTPDQPHELPPDLPENKEGSELPDYLEILKRETRRKGEEEKVTDLQTPEGIQEDVFDEIEHLYPNPTPKRPRLVQDTNEDTEKENRKDKEN